MFRRLLANLPYNPSLFEQVSFYAGRLRQETAVRRLGFLFVALAMIVQMYAVMAPPEPSLALSNNDIIPGGITSVSDAHRHCMSNDYGFADIVRSYGITCDNVAAGAKVSIRSTDHAGELYSLGRLPYGKPGEAAYVIRGIGTFYLRPLKSWDTRAYSTYTAVSGHNIFGEPFWILFDCGNLVMVGENLPAPEQPAPAPQPAPEPAPQPAPKKPEPTDVCDNIPGVQTRTSECDVCPLVDGVQSDEAECKPCDKSAADDDATACVVLGKSARNLDRDGADADGTTAGGGDTIEYRLSATNDGKIGIDSFVFEENISDVLDYAEVVSLNGGKLSDKGVIKWPAVPLPAGSSLGRTFTVRIKDPVPATPASTSDPGHFDLVMTNVYGDAVSIKLLPPAAKTAEVVSKSLPSTGPGGSLLIGFVGTTFAGYLLARSRLMSRELELVREEYAAGGGF